LRHGGDHHPPVREDFERALGDETVHRLAHGCQAGTDLLCKTAQADLLAGSERPDHEALPDLLVDEIVNGPAPVSLVPVDFPFTDMIHLPSLSPVVYCPPPDYRHRQKSVPSTTP